jgi:hypothetical protein
MLSTLKKKEIKNILPKFRQALKQFTESPNASGLDCYKKADLACSCAIASHALAILLKFRGIENKLIFGVYIDKYLDLDRLSPIDINHVWVEVNDYIVDVTASQFGEKEIVFRKKRNRTKTTTEPFLSLVKVDVEKIKAETKLWPKTQTPSRKTLKSILQNYSDISGEEVPL